MAARNGLFKPVIPLVPLLPTRVTLGAHDARGPSCVPRLWPCTLGTWQGGSYELGCLVRLLHQTQGHVISMCLLARKHWDQTNLGECSVHFLEEPL